MTPSGQISSTVGDPSPSLADSLGSQTGDNESSPEPQPKNWYSKDINVFDVIMKSDEIDGEPVESIWRWSRLEIDVPIRSLTPEEFKRIIDNHTKKIRIGRTAQYSTELETRGYNAEIVATVCRNPDFQDPSIRKQFAEKFSLSEDNAQDVIIVQKIWLIGELASIAMAVLDLTGFSDEDESIKALKDSSSGETT